MRILNSEAVTQALSYADCIEAVAGAMKSVSEGKSIMPLRQYMDIPGGEGKFTLMPGYVSEPASFGVKIVSKFPRSANSPYGSHVGAVVIFDTEQGIPVAILDAATLTAIRTASASALATKVLSRADSKILTILGTGTEALHHARAVLCVRDINQIRIWGRTTVHAQTLAVTIEKEAGVGTQVASDIEKAVADADIICTTTAAKEPILKGEWLPAGCHVNLVGAAVMSAAEVDIEVVTRSRFFVDYRESAMAQAGELNAAIKSGSITADHIIAEIGELLNSGEAGRNNDEDITVYKSLGVAAQDLAAGMMTYECAEKNKIGMELDW